MTPIIRRGGAQNMPIKSLTCVIYRLDHRKCHNANFSTKYSTMGDLSSQGRHRPQNIWTLSMVQTVGAGLLPHQYRNIQPAAVETSPCNLPCFTVCFIYSFLLLLCSLREFVHKGEWGFQKQKKVQTSFMDDGT